MVCLSVAEDQPELRLSFAALDSHGQMQVCYS